MIVLAAALAAATLPCPKDYPFGWRTSALELGGKRFTRLNPAELRDEIIGKSISDPSTMPPWGYHFGDDGHYGESGDRWEDGGRFQVHPDGFSATGGEVPFRVAFFHAADGSYLMGFHRNGCMMVKRVIVREVGR